MHNYIPMNNIILVTRVQIIEVQIIEGRLYPNAPY